MFKLALNNLLKHKTRTILSMLGIIIGVASIIVLVAVVDGLLFDVQNAVSQIQGVTVMEKGSLGPLFSKIDVKFADELKKMPYVKRVIGTGTTLPRSVENKKVTYTIPPIRLIGSDYSQKSFDTAAGIGGELDEGRTFNGNEKGKVLIGKDLKKKLNKFVGNKIKINGKKFTIIGIYVTSSKMFNSSILMSIDDFRELEGISKDVVPEYIIELTDSSKTEKVVKLINFRFKDKLKAFSSQSFSSTIGSFIDSLRLLVIAIAAIAAIVAGIGILNTMLMTVMERFKEIGTLKAIGWTKENILLMITFESVLLGFFGSIAGLILGITLSLIVIQGIFNLTVIFQPYLLIGSFLFGIIISLIAGVYPAKIASELSPIEALRTE